MKELKATAKKLGVNEKLLKMLDPIEYDMKMEQQVLIELVKTLTLEKIKPTMTLIKAYIRRLKCECITEDTINWKININKKVLKFQTLYPEKFITEDTLEFIKPDRNDYFEKYVLEDMMYIDDFEKKKAIVAYVYNPERNAKEIYSFILLPNNFIRDYANNLIMNKDDYYKLFKVEEKIIYTRTEIKNNVTI